jgi:hypothetical protein
MGSKKKDKKKRQDVDLYLKNPPQNRTSIHVSNVPVRLDGDEGGECDGELIISFTSTGLVLEVKDDEGESLGMSGWDYDMFAQSLIPKPVVAAEAM